MSFIGSGESLKIKNNVLPSFCWYRSARADCFAFEKFNLFAGDWDPISEWAKREAGPYWAIINSSELYSISFCKDRSISGWGKYWNSSSYSEWGYSQSMKSKKL